MIQISYHFVITKIQKLQNLKKKKKKLFSVPPGTPGTGRYCPKLAGTAGIFSGTKQGGRVYRIAGRYGIFRPVRPVRYGIDIHAYKYNFQISKTEWMRKELLQTKTELWIVKHLTMVCLPLFGFRASLVCMYMLKWRTVYF